MEVTIERQGKTETRSGRWLIGADGARSDVRRSLGIAFDGFTWPERFLVVSTPFDFSTVIPDLVAVSYVTDPQALALPAANSGALPRDVPGGG